MRKFPRLPTITLRIPMPTGVYLSGGKMIFGGIVFIALVALSALFMVANTDSPLPVYPDPGTYTLIETAEGQALVAQRNPVDPVSGQRDHTLRINLNGNRTDGISFTDISLGETGLVNAIEITNSATTTYFLKCQTVTLDDVAAPTFNMSNSEIYHLSVTSTVSGHTIAPALSTSIEDVTVGSTRGTGKITASGKTVDRIVIDVNSSTQDALCTTLDFTGVKTSVGAVDIQQLKAGTFLLMSNTRFGEDTDIGDSDFIIATTTLYTILNDGVTDAPVVVQ